MLRGNSAHGPEPLSLRAREPVLPNKRSPRNEKLTHLNEEQPPFAATRGKPMHRNRDPAQPKINKIIN